jgi:hypothetical protein
MEIEIDDVAMPVADIERSAQYQTAVLPIQRGTCRRYSR